MSRARRVSAGGVVVAVLVVLLLISSCSHTVRGSGQPASPVGSAPGGSSGSSGPPGSSGPSAPPGSSGPGASSGPAACPSAYIAPDPRRPVVALTFTVAPDHATVTGTEKVAFTPDADISELVFRLTANTVPTFAAGTQIRVTKATADHNAGPARYENAGAAAASQGGLLRLPFPNKITSGTTVHAELEFTLTLGKQAFDRFGRAGGVAWFASAQPLLAWERGFGWHTEPMLQFTAESATSEAARTDLTVTAPAADVVQTSGAATPVSSADGRRTWHATLDAARDVSVAVGPFATTTVDVDGTHLYVGAVKRSELSGVVSDARFALDGLTRRFGPFPFPALTITLLPVNGGGIEYPSSILLLGSYRLVTVHEIAHQWFYAMVGDSQAQHAWLDEAFATYAEQLTDSTPINSAALKFPGRVDTATTAYGADGPRYYRTTYDKGAAALRTAREAAGPGRFDAAIRCYVNANAWTVADPPDLGRALAGLPAAVTVLRRAGAL